MLNGGFVDTTKSVNHSNVAGTTMSFDLKNADEQYGWIREEVRIGTDREGRTQSMAFAYIHPHFSASGSITVKGFLSLDVNITSGDEWTWSYAFVIERL